MKMINNIQIESVTQLLSAIKEDTKNWTHTGFAKPWFRGHTKTSYKLLPAILRNGNEKYEVKITTKFRLIAPGFSSTPETNRIDQWLFLMQHHRTPTRLLDWSESPLIAAFFATIKASKTYEEISDDAAIFALDPVALNKQSGFDFFPNTWIQSSVLQTIKFAFGTQEEPVDGKRIPYLEYPTAVYPSTIHSRIKSQKGCFTLHGSDRRDFEAIFANRALIKENQLIKYVIPKEKIEGFFSELNDFGITYSNLFPDLDGLAKELKYQFKIVE
jgi:hypothetical protein